VVKVIYLGDSADFVEGYFTTNSETSTALSGINISMPGHFIQ
jgi:hypothetical protein